MILMKNDIHPQYYSKAVITCSCGAKFTMGSTVEENTTELCSKCHPFFSGKEKIIDTEGRVDKFRARQKAAEQFKKTQ
jgi:large subunit ribosomal protein L31